MTRAPICNRADHDWKRGRVDNIKRIAHERCTRCHITRRVAVVRCSCYQQRPTTLWDPIRNEPATSAIYQSDLNCQECGGTGWLDVPAERPCCCYDGTPVAGRCQNCKDARGRIHVCAALEERHGWDAADDAAMVDAPRSRASQAARDRAGGLQV